MIRQTKRKINAILAVELFAGSFNSIVATAVSAPTVDTSRKESSYTDVIEMTADESDRR